MLAAVFLRRAIYSRSMMQEVMCQVVANVAEDATAVRGHSSVPVVEKHDVSKLPERSC